MDCVSCLPDWYPAPPESLAADLPGVDPRNELGDRSLRASSPKGDILGFAWLDEKWGVVVLLTCGAAQCRSHDTVLGLARIVEERIDATLGAAP